MTELAVSFWMASGGRIVSARGDHVNVQKYPVGWQRFLLELREGLTLPFGPNKLAGAGEHSPR